MLHRESYVHKTQRDCGIRCNDREEDLFCYCIPLQLKFMIVSIDLYIDTI